MFSYTSKLHNRNIRLNIQGHCLDRGHTNWSVNMVKKSFCAPNTNTSFFFLNFVVVVFLMSLSTLMFVTAHPGRLLLNRNWYDTILYYACYPSSSLTSCINMMKCTQSLNCWYLRLKTPAFAYSVFIYKRRVQWQVMYEGIVVTKTEHIFRGQFKLAGNL